MTQQDTSGAVPAEYPDLARMLVEAQRAAQESLIQSGRSRAQLDQKLKDARAAAESFTRSFEPDASLLNRYSRAWAAYGARGGTQAGEAPLPSSLEQARMTWLQCEQRCERRLQGFNQRKSEYDKSQKKIFGRIKETPVLPDEFRQDLRMMGGVVEALPALRARELEARLEQARSEFTPLMQAELAVREAALSELLERSIADLSVGVELLGEQALSWPEFLSASRSAPTTLDARLRLGYFNATLPVSAVPRVPCVLEFPHRRGLAVEAGLANRADALELVRSAVLRLLLAVPAGQLQLSIFDPVAIGRSLADFLHLGDFDERLVDTRPRTSASDIEAKLAEHAAYLETIISKYLRGQFETIEEYNRQAGEMAEPYRLLVVCDFPTQFSERAIEQLLSIVENGPRCGLFTLLMYSPGAPLSRDVTYERLLASMDRVTWTGKDARLTVDGKALELDIVIDRCPVLSFDPAGKATSEAAALLAGVGAAARKAEDTSVGLDQTFQILNRMMSAGLVGRLPVLREGATAVNIRDEQTWWSGNTTSGATAPLGRAGAQSVSSLYFSSTEIAGGALMVGLPRSGKTTSLHAAILSMAMIYSPSELELFLIDAKHGVEFNAYSALPHARMVAINSEREFAVAVLESLDREIGRRAELMKHETPGRTNIEEYRKVSGQGMPRIVVVIDEFHELFEEVDQLGQAAFAAFSNIVRQGPFAGVHLVLASQTLSGMPAMDRSTLTLLPARVAFACNEDDGDIVMGDKNPEVKFLTRAGEGLLNPDRGDPLHNIRFQGAYVSPDERDGIVRDLVAKAARTGWARTPRVFDGDALADRSLVPPGIFSTPSDRPNRLKFVVGEPLSLEAHLEVVLRRDLDNNVALIGRSNDEDGEPIAGLIGVLNSLLLAASHQVEEVHVVDLLNDEGVPAEGKNPGRLSLEQITTGLGLAFHKRRALAATIRSHASIVDERIVAEDYLSPTRVLVLYGLQRAADLDPEDYSEDEEPSATALKRILRDGPEVGVHTILVADSASSLARRLGDLPLEHVALRICGPLSSDEERQAVLGLYQSFDLRFNHLVLFDRERDRRTKFQPYGPVSAQWLALASLDERITTKES